MKNIYFLISSIFIINHVNAQLTLTKAFNEPIIGDFFDAKSIDTTTILPMNVIGMGVTWNMSGISESGALNTNTYSPASAYVGASATFPGLNLVKEDQTTGDLSYFKVTPTTFELLGSFTSLGVANANLNYNTNSAVVLSYPVSMGYTNNDIGAGTITTSTLSGTFTSTIQTIADGAGSLVFNGGITLTNCLRVKTKQHIAFAFLGGLFSGTVDQNLYSYYHSSSKHPVFTVSYNHIVSPGLSFAGIPPIDNRQAKVEMLSTLTIGLHELNSNSLVFKMFPNPSTDEINIQFHLTQNETCTIEIINSLGQIVNTSLIPNLNTGLYDEKINVSNLESGIYSVKVKGKNSYGFQKLMVY
jgi:hypothetical protein